MKDLQELALRLAILLTPDSSLPPVYKRDFSNKSDVEKEKILKNQWKLTEDKTALTSFVNQNMVIIKDMADQIGIQLTERLVMVKPIVENNLKSVANCMDFIAITTYFDKFRSENPDRYDEIGILSMLIGKIQGYIEAISATSTADIYVNDTEKKRFQLKNRDAQMLLDFGKTVINGVEINLWQGHTKYSVNAQQGWNKVKRFSEINNLSSGEAGHIVFSGIMQVKRQEAIDYAIKLGFKVHSNVSKNTDFFIVGSENVSPLDTLRVEKIQKGGGKVKVISENEFLEMVIREFNL